VERWRSDCGCNTGGHPEWNQKWRGPLRAALDELGRELSSVFEVEGRRVLVAPWQARNEYVGVVLSREPETIDAFLEKHRAGERSEADDVCALKLLEMQRHAMLMYTSCGWFFDDLSGIETIQILRYAGRAIQLAESVSTARLEETFLARLDRAHSNLGDFGSGRDLFQAQVKPVVVDPVTVGSHYAISTLFEDYPQTARLYCYEVHQAEHHTFSSGPTRLNIGRARIHSRITREAESIAYAVLHLGDHNISGGACEMADTDSFARLVQDVASALEQMDLTRLIGLFSERFGANTFSLRTLFRNEQRRYLDRVLGDAVRHAEEAYVRVHTANASVMRFLAGLGLPQPDALRVAGERALNYQLLRALACETPDPAKIAQLLQESRDGRYALRGEELGFAYQKKLETLAQAWWDDPFDPETLNRLAAGVALVPSLPFEVSLWGVQNVYYAVREAHAYPVQKSTQEKDRAMRAWTERCQRLGQALGFGLD
jgi:hypothetical protein